MFKTQENMKIAQHLLCDDEHPRTNKVSDAESKLMSKRVVLKNVKQRIQAKRQNIELGGDKEQEQEPEFDFNSIILKNDHGKVLDLSLLPISYLK